MMNKKTMIAGAVGTALYTMLLGGCGQKTTHEHTNPGILPDTAFEQGYDRKNVNYQPQASAIGVNMKKPGDIDSIEDTLTPFKPHRPLYGGSNYVTPLKDERGNFVELKDERGNPVGKNTFGVANNYVNWEDTLTGKTAQNEADMVEQLPKHAESVYRMGINIKDTVDGIVFYANETSSPFDADVYLSRDLFDTTLCLTMKPSEKGKVSTTSFGIDDNAALLRYGIDVSKNTYFAGRILGLEGGLILGAGGTTLYKVSSKGKRMMFDGESFKKTDIVKRSKLDELSFSELNGVEMQKFAYKFNNATFGLNHSSRVPRDQAIIPVDNGTYVVGLPMKDDYKIVSIGYPEKDANTNKLGNITTLCVAKPGTNDYIQELHDVLFTLGMSELGKELNKPDEVGVDMEKPPEGCVGAGCDTQPPVIPDPEPVITGEHPDGGPGIKGQTN